MTVITKDDRVLFVVVNLSTHGGKKFQPLYEWLDDNFIVFSKHVLHKHYRYIATLSGDVVTSTNFINRIIGLANDTRNKVLDVFISLHGEKNLLYFDDGPINSNDIGNELKAADIKHKLRLLYSSACYGASHAPHFVNGGFGVASGAKETAANGAFDIPYQLFSWAKGDMCEDVVAKGNNAFGIRVSDGIARTLGFDDVDSTKEIKGDKTTTINSPTN